MFDNDFHRNLYKKLAEEGSRSDRGTSQGIFEQKLHQSMQNPEDGVVIFDNIPRSMLHNYNLSTIPQYFDYKTGEHIFGVTINKLQISNVRLSGYNHGIGDPMPDGTEFIASIISQNAKIKIIDLSYTQLGDYEAVILIKALKSNTHLWELNLTGNSISEEKLNRIRKERLKQLLGEASSWRNKLEKNNTK